MFGHEYQDARTLVSWGIDYFKVDNCYQQFEIIDVYQRKLLGYNNSGLYGLSIRGVSDAPIHYRGIDGLPPFRPQKGGQISTGGVEAFKLVGDALRDELKRVNSTRRPELAVES